MLPTPTAPSPSNPLPEIQRLAWQPNAAPKDRIATGQCALLRGSTALPISTRKPRPGRPSAAPRRRRAQPFRTSHGPRRPTRRPCLQPGECRSRGTVDSHRSLWRHRVVATRAASSAAPLNSDKLLISHPLLFVLQEKNVTSRESRQGRFTAASRRRAAILWTAVDNIGDK